MEGQIDLSQKFYCGKCKNYIGTYNELLNDAAMKHYCLRNADNINLDIAHSLVYSDHFNEELASTSTTSSDVNTKSQRAQSVGIENVEEVKLPRSLETSAKEFWTEAQTRLLIATYAEEKDKFDSPRHSVTTVFKKISQKMAEQGVIVSYQKCEKKWRNLRKTYEKVARSNSETGNSRTKFQFYEEMNEILFKDPKVFPICTVSNVEVKTRKLQDTDTNETPSKRTKKTDLENQKQKRHEEKLTFKKEVFEWFKENFNKKGDSTKQ